MVDAVGVKIKKGDLLLAMYTYKNSGVYTSYKVALDFTPKKVVVGKSSNYTSRKPTVFPDKCVVVNHVWEKVLTYNDIANTISEFKIIPNREIRKPIVEEKINITGPDEDNLEDI